MSTVKTVHKRIWNTYDGEYDDVPRFEAREAKVVLVEDFTRPSADDAGPLARLRSFFSGSRSSAVRR
jgi:hypothetical protein